MNRIITTALLAFTLVGLGVIAPTAANAAVLPMLNTCTRVVVQKQLPWYRCVNLYPGNQSYPAACYGDVTKIVCSR